MAADSVHLRAFDEFAGQALFESGGTWFRASSDDDWTPTQLPDMRAAIRCTLLAPFGARDERFPSIADLQSHLRELWRQAFDVEDVPLTAILHLLPASIQRHYQRLEDRRSAQADWERQQAHRHRESWQSERPRPAPRPPIAVELPSLLPVPPPSEPHKWERVWRYARDAARVEFERRFARPVPFDEEDIASVATGNVLRYLQREPKPKIEDFRRFVRVVVARTCVDSFRAAYRRSRSPSTEIESLPPELRVDQLVQPPDQPMLAAETRLDIQQAIDRVRSRLPEPAQAVADAAVSRLLREEPQPPLEELSKSLGIKVHTLYSRMFRFRKMLAAELKTMGYGGDDWP